MPDIDLEGVEYKCLPSGLHEVKEDLVYFVQNTYAGISAYVRAEADEGHRNASFVTVGALVPLSYGRLGKSWFHAQDLRRLARENVQGMLDQKALESFWERHRQGDRQDTQPVSPSTVRRASSPPEFKRLRNRASSASSSAAADDWTLPDHPALAAIDLLDTFGPLLFLLYRAALARKRVLILGTAPVQQNCNFIYLLSILSSIPESLVEAIRPSATDLLRTQTLFNVGIHDIPDLSQAKRKSHWLACTTDDILGEKKMLYDVLVKFPTTTLRASTSSSKPSMQTSDGQMIKATQRDLRRYRLLRAELQYLHSLQGQADGAASETEGMPGDESISLLRRSTTTLLQEVKSPEQNESDVVESPKWTAMIYNGFMWWASAGEMDAWENEEANADRQLLDDLPDLDLMLPHPGKSHDRDEHPLDVHATAALLTAYFHRLTIQIIQPLADLVAEADDASADGVAQSAIAVSSDDIRAMGLDSWSAGDVSFVKDMLHVYYGREAAIDSGGTQVCGLRIC